MNDARKRRFDCVLVWRFDRFARSTKHLLLALEEFRSLGIQFISYQEKIDTTSPLGQALFTIVSAVARLERDLIRERVKAGLRNARAKGRVLGRPRIAVGAHIVARLRSQGYSWAEVCRILKAKPGNRPASGTTVFCAGLTRCAGASLSRVVPQRKPVCELLYVRFRAAGAGCDATFHVPPADGLTIFSLTIV
jgi:hypothetical protein